MSQDNVRELLLAAANRAASYIDQLKAREVRAQRGAVDRLMRALEGPLPSEPTRGHDILAFLDDYGSPATVASAGGRYFGFVTGGALPVTVAAQYLAAGWDQNCFSFVSSPAVACLETTALRWLKEALGLPSSAEGALVTGATMANFTCLAAARNWTLHQHGWDVDQKGLFGAPALTVVLGEEAHATIYKVLSMLGLGRERVLRVPADTQGRMRADCLPDISGPAVLCVQAGNVNSGAFDPARELIAWARQRHAWVHVDGAFGLWALASAQLAPSVRAFVGADSWAMDAHKWLNVPYDCGIAAVADASAHRAAMTSTSAYIPAHDDSIPWGFDWTPEFSRRARGVTVYAVLRSLGRNGIAELIDDSCEHAERIADRLTKADGVAVLNDVVLNQVLVRVDDDDAATNAVIEKVQRDGTCWLSGSTFKGQAVMRISIVGWQTTTADINRSADAILEAAQTVRAGLQAR